MKPNYSIVLSLFVLLLLITGCESETLVLPEKAFGYEYYPVEEGNFWIYKVDSTVYFNEGGQVNSRLTSSYVKEEITSSFLNEQGDTSYVLQRSVAENQTGNYRSTDIWKIEKTTSNVSRFEENLHFIKMVFPIDVGNSWDGNLFDQGVEVVVAQQRMEPYKEWAYSTESISATETIDGNTYSDVIKIIQAEYHTEIEQRISYEKYAPGIGMVFRKMSILDTQCIPCPNMSWEEKAERGYQLRQTLVDHN